MAFIPSPPPPKSKALPKTVTRPTSKPSAIPLTAASRMIFLL